MAHLDNENKSDWYDELDDQFVALSGFLDIYGDMKSNSYMISTAATAKSIPELLSDYDFLLELPYTSYVARSQHLPFGLALQDQKRGMEASLSLFLHIIKYA